MILARRFPMVEVGRVMQQSRWIDGHDVSLQIGGPVLCVLVLAGWLASS